jgi:nucleoside-diphosphate-sugar epimerase
MSPYALNKWEGELHAEMFRKLHGLEVNYIRPFNVYGSRQNPHSEYSAAVPKFIDTLLTGGKPYITGDGEQRRDFIYVDDVVEIIYLASKCKESGEAFNAGSGVHTSINELFTAICKAMNKDVKPDYVEKVFEPAMTLADMTKVKRILKFTPKIDLEEGLRRTVEAYAKETSRD